MLLSAKKYICQFSCLFLITLFPVPELFACSPGEGNPWYIINFELDPKQFPKGVELVIKDYAPIQSKPEILAKEYILINNTDIPFEFRNIYPWDLETDLRIVSGKSNFKMGRGDWQSNFTLADPDADISISIYPGMPGLEAESKILQVVADNRPVNITPPVPHDVWFNAYYGGKPFRFKGKISYELNTDYDPQARAKAIQGCEALMSHYFKPRKRKVTEGSSDGIL